MGTTITGILDTVNTLGGLATTPDNQLGTFRQALKKGVQAACNGFANTPGQGILSTFTGPGVLLSEVCAPYYAQNGLLPPSNYPGLPGGQCPKVYRYTASGTGGQAATLEGFITGPIGARRLVPSGGTAADGSPGWQVRYQGGGGTEVIVSFVNMRRQDAVTWKIISAVPTDGSADNCGPTPSGTSPGSAPVYNFGDTFNFDAGGVQVPIKVDLPDINIDGRLSIPINVGGIQINFPDAPPVGASEPDPSGAAPVGAAPPIPGDELAGDNGDFGDPPAGTEWVGAIVEVTDYPEGFGNVSGPLPNRVFPTVIGNFRLKLQSETGKIFLSENSQIREDMQSLFRRNDGVKVRGAVVNVVQNVAYEVTPLYAETVSDT